jgi:hypothetical protein
LTAVVEVKADYGEQEKEDQKGGTDVVRGCSSVPVARHVEWLTLFARITAL